MSNAVTKNIAKAVVGTVLTAVLGSGFALTASASIAAMAGEAELGLVAIDDDTEAHGDFDSDGDVDGNDFLIWQEHRTTAAARSGDGLVDGQDFNIWH